jgi:hypothetical protein
VSDLLGSYQLPSPERGDPVLVELFQGVEEQQIQFIETHWMPVLRQLQNQAILKVKSKSIADDIDRRNAFIQAQSSVGSPDGHWDWRDKMEEAAKEAHASFFVRHENSVEAIMECRLLHFAREPSQANQPAVYVNHVAVAPWNRNEIKNPRNIAKLGDLMIATAISLSLDEGFSGRTGLHSLPQAEGFYLNCGMSDLGLDNHYGGLRYFEFTSAQAAAFIS